MTSLSVRKEIRRNLPNTSWFVVGRLIKLGLSFAVGIFVARHLGPQAFGRYNFTISYVMLFAIVSSLGLNHLMLRKFSESPEKRGVYLGTCTTLKLLTAFGLYAALAVISHVVDLNRADRILVYVYGSSLLFLGLDMVTVYLESIRCSRLFIQAELMQALLFTVLKIWCVSTGKPVLWFVVIQATEWLTIAAMVYPMVWKNDREVLLDWSFNPSTAKELLSESYPFILASAAVVLYQRIDQVMLYKMSSAKEVGYYAAATRFTVFLGVLPVLLSRSLTPSLLDAKKQSLVSFYRRFLFLDSMIIWGTFASITGVVLLSEPLVNTLYGKTYSDSASILRILAGKSLFMAMGASSGQYILIRGLQKFGPVRQGTGCIVNILMNAFMIPRWGAIGAAWASLASSMLALFLIHAFLTPLRPLFSSQCHSLFRGPILLIKHLRQHDSTRN